MLAVLYNILSKNQPVQILLLLFSFFAIVLTFVYFCLPSKYFSSKQKILVQLIGVVFIVVLSFAASNIFVYLIGTIIIATLVTELGFLEKLMALLWNRPEYWLYDLEKAKLQNAVANQDTEVANLKSSKENEDIGESYKFEVIYRVIFNDQLKILSMLRDQGKLVKPALQSIYLRSVWNGVVVYENFVGFLESTDLIKYYPSEDLYEITNSGRNFLAYLEKFNIPFIKIAS